jgi:DNA sulfur modification protein DndE
VKILIAGDSTAANYKATLYPMMGWGQALEYFAKPDVEVLNFAMPGRSTKSFRAEGHWQRLLDNISLGDWIFIQFGHNDQKIEQEIGVQEDDFRNNLSRMYDEVRERGGNVLLLTGVLRCAYDRSGLLIETQGNYPQIIRETAEKFALPLVDAQSILREFEKRNGRMALQELYCYPSPPGNWVPPGALDTSHFSISGAHKVAQMIADDIKRQQLPMADLFY